jgi:arsenite-transporting ATPase
MRIIFFAGKGGVGKTSVAAATGVRAADQGCRTLIMSLDVAHSLADIFDLDRDLLDQGRGRPVKVHPNLWIQELDIQEEIDRNWGDIHRYLSGLLNTTGLNEVLAEELAVLPGMEEVSLLLYINQYVRQRRFDALLLDCAPTGESLRFISIPTTLEWYMKKLFKLERTIVRCARPLAKRLTDVPLPGEAYFNALERLFSRLEGVDRILADPAVTTVRLVTNPEKVVIKETQRAFMYFCLYRMSIDAVIMNRLLPSGIRDGFFSNWLTSQGRYAELARTYFHPVPVLPVNLFKEEILGPERLAALADEIYAERNPLERFFEEEPYRLIKENGRYRLQLKLPFVVKERIELSKVSDELILRIGSYKRHMMLPKPLVSVKTVAARVDPPYLNILFGGIDS